MRKIAVYSIHVASNFSQIAIVLLLATQLSKLEFGLFSSYYSVYLIASILSDGGIGIIGLREKSVSKEAPPSLIVIQFVFGILTLAASGIFFEIFGELDNGFYKAALAGAICGLLPIWLFSELSYSVAILGIKILLGLCAVIVIENHAPLSDIFTLVFVTYVPIYFAALFYYRKKIFIRFEKKNFIAEVSKVSSYIYQHVGGSIALNATNLIIYKSLGPASVATFSLADKMTRGASLFLSPLRVMIINSKNGYDIKKIGMALNVLCAFAIIGYLFAVEYAVDYFLGEKYDIRSLQIIGTLLLTNIFVLAHLDMKMTHNFYLNGRDKELNLISTLCNFCMLLTMFMFSEFSVYIYPLVMLFNSILLYILIALNENKNYCNNASP